MWCSPCSSATISIIRFFDAWVSGKFRWAVSTEILLEHEEVAARMAGPAYATLIFRAMNAVAASRRSLLHISPSFRFNLITNDLDDNKFADCAIAADADFIVTADSRFECIKRQQLQTAAHHAGGVHSFAFGRGKMTTGEINGTVMDC